MRCLALGKLYWRNRSSRTGIDSAEPPLRRALPPARRGPAPTSYSPAPRAAPAAPSSPRRHRAWGRDGDWIIPGEVDDPPRLRPVHALQQPVEQEAEADQVRQGVQPAQGRFKRGTEIAIRPHRLRRLSRFHCTSPPGNSPGLRRTSLKAGFTLPGGLLGGEMLEGTNAVHQV
eukprot:gene9482-biopygen7628